MAAQSSTQASEYVQHLSRVKNIYPTNTIKNRIIDPTDQSSTITIVTKTISITRKEAMDNWDEYEEIFAKVQEQTIIDDDTVINFHTTTVMDLDFAHDVYIEQDHVSEHIKKRIQFKYKYREYYQSTYELHFLIDQFNQALDDIKSGTYDPEKYIPIRLFLDPTDYPIYSKDQEKLLADLGIYKGFHCRVRPSSFNGFDFEQKTTKLMNSYYVVQGMNQLQDGSYNIRKDLCEKIFSIGYFRAYGSYVHDVLQKQISSEMIYFTWFDIIIESMKNYKTF